MKRTLLAPLLRCALWIRRLEVMTVKELKQLSRDIALMVFIIYAFTLEIYVAGSGVALELKNASLLVHDADHSAASRDLIYRFQPPYFNLSNEVAHGNEGVRLLDRGEAMLLLDIPPQFSETLLRAERTAQVQLLVDTSNSTIGYLASSYSTRIGQMFSENWIQERLILAGLDPRSLPSIENERRIWYNPDLKSSWFNAISELLGMMTVVAVLLPGAALVREKERGTIEQLLVSPLSPFQVMFSKVLAMTLVILLGVALSLFAIMQPFFAVPARGSLILFFCLTALYAFTTSGLGLVAATFARNQAQVGMLTILMVAPMIMLSGTWTPPEAMPVWLRYLVQLSPLHHYIGVAYGILLRGVGLNVLWPAALSMLALGGMLFGLGLWRFRRQFG